MRYDLADNLRISVQQRSYIQTDQRNVVDGRRVADYGLQKRIQAGIGLQALLDRSFQASGLLVSTLVLVRSNSSACRVALKTWFATKCAPSSASAMRCWINCERKTEANAATTAT